MAHFILHVLVVSQCLANFFTQEIPQAAAQPLDGSRNRIRRHAELISQHLILAMVRFTLEEFNKEIESLSIAFPFQGGYGAVEEVFRPHPVKVAGGVRAIRDNRRFLHVIETDSDSSASPFPSPGALVFVIEEPP